MLVITVIVITVLDYFAVSKKLLREVVIMKAKTFLPILLIVIVLFPAVACREAPAPPALTQTPAVTPMEEATMPPTATTTTAPPTATAPAELTATPVPETPTLAPTATAEPEATATPAALTITDPAAGVVVAPGSALTVAGRAPADAAAVAVALRAAGMTLAAVEASVAETAWVATVDVPENVTGPAVLEAALDGEPAESLSLEIRRAQAASGSAISLDYPTAESKAVAGHVLFFQGRVQQPIDGAVTIEVRYDDCQSTAARQAFDVGQGGQWWGFVVVPETVFGPACAMASTGEMGAPGEGAWRAAQTELELLAIDDEEARGVFVGNFPNTEVTPGGSVAVYGSAFNAPGRQVTVALRVEEETVAEEEVTADAFGYWTADLVLPADVTAPGGSFVAVVQYEEGEETASVPFLTGR